MKRCPLCAEDIQDKAIKCKHCGSMLPKETAAPSPRKPPDRLSALVAKHPVKIIVGAIGALALTGWILQLAGVVHPTSGGSTRADRREIAQRLQSTYRALADDGRVWVTVDGEDDVVLVIDAYGCNERGLQRLLNSDQQTNLAHAGFTEVRCRDFNGSIFL